MKLWFNHLASKHFYLSLSGTLVTELGLWPVYPGKNTWWF